MKKISTLGLSLLMAAVLSACGGGGSSDASSSGNGGNGNPGGGTGDGSAGLCSGNAWQTAGYDVYTGGATTATRQTGTFYGASKAAASQCIAVNNTLKLTTTDAFSNVSWQDASGNALAGSAADKFTENLLLACASGASNARYLAVRADVGAAVFTGAAAATMVANALPFQSTECASGNVSVGQSTLSFGVDKSATVQDSRTTTFTPAQVQQAFSEAGLTLDNGTVIRWTLYVVPVGALTRQVIVHRGAKPDGSVNVFAFLQKS